MFTSCRSPWSHGASRTNNKILVGNVTLYKHNETFNELLTWNKREVEVIAGRILIAASTVARQPKLEWRTVSRAVTVDCADRNDRLAGRLVLVHHRSIVVRKFRRIIVHIQQSYEYRPGPSLRWNTCTLQPPLRHKLHK